MRALERASLRKMRAQPIAVQPHKGILLGLHLSFTAQAAGSSWQMRPTTYTRKQSDRERHCLTPKQPGKADLLEDGGDEGVIRLGAQVQGGNHGSLLLKAIAAQLIGTCVQTFLLFQQSPGLQQQPQG